VVAGTDKQPEEAAAKFFQDTRGHADVCPLRAMEPRLPVGRFELASEHGSRPEELKVRNDDSPPMLFYRPDNLTRHHTRASDRN